jgi:hypothetical protein
VLFADLAQPGHWLGPVTGLGRLGLAQSMWAELSPAPNNKKNKKNKKYKKV